MTPKKHKRHILRRLHIPEISLALFIIASFYESTFTGLAVAIALIHTAIFNSAWLILAFIALVVYAPPSALYIFAVFIVGKDIVGMILSDRLDSSITCDSHRILFLFDGAEPLLLSSGPSGKMHLSHIKSNKSSLWRLSQQLEKQISSCLSGCVINGIRIISAMRLPHPELRLEVTNSQGKTRCWRSWVVNYYIIKSNILSLKHAERTH